MSRAEQQIKLRGEIAVIGSILCSVIVQFTINDVTLLENCQHLMGELLLRDTGINAQAQTQSISMFKGEDGHWDIAQFVGY